MDFLFLKHVAHWDRIVHPISNSVLAMSVVLKQMKAGEFSSHDVVYRNLAMFLFLLLSIINAFKFGRGKQLQPYLTRRIIIFFVLTSIVGVEVYIAEKSTFLLAIFVATTTLDFISRLSLLELHETQFFEQLKNENPKRVFSKVWTLFKVPLFPVLVIQTVYHALILFNGYIFIKNFSKHKEYSFRIAVGHFFTTTLLHLWLNVLHIFEIKQKNTKYTKVFYRVYTTTTVVAWISHQSLLQIRPITNSEHFTSLVISQFSFLFSNFTMLHAVRYVTYITLEKQLPLGEYAPYYETLETSESNGKNLFKLASQNSKHVRNFLKRITVSRNKLTIGDEIGFGHFGKVYKAHLSKVWRKRIPVAVKIPNFENNRSSIEAFLTELKIMHVIGSHPSLVSFFGITEIEDSCGIILEYCELGDLLSYIRDLKPASTKVVTGRMLQWALEISEAMKYLSSRSVVHGDLAARNVLLDANFRCKVSDFGMSLTLYQYQVYAKTNSKEIPFRWMAPEGLKDLKFSVKSDVYSYGVLLFEIFSYGCEPWENEVDPSQLLAKLENGAILFCPEACRSVWFESIIKSCWCVLPADRPTFEDLLDKIKGISEEYNRDTYLEVQEV